LVVAIFATPRTAHRTLSGIQRVSHHSAVYWYWQ
jgi:hypothetical protein